MQIMHLRAAEAHSRKDYRHHEKGTPEMHAAMKIVRVLVMTALWGQNYVRIEKRL